MPEEQVKAFLEAAKKDPGLRKAFKAAAGVSDAVTVAQKSGFDLSKADWLKYQARETLALTDEELERMAGGFGTAASSYMYPTECADHRCQAA